MSSGFIINGTDLDNLFKARITTKRADVGFKDSTNVDLSNLYEKSVSASDQLALNTGFTTSDGTDLRYLFQRADYSSGGDPVIPPSYIPFSDTLQFTIEQYYGDCWKLIAVSSTGKVYNYRVIYKIKNDYTDDFISSSSTTLIRNPLNTGGSTFYFYKIQLLNSAKTQILATWDVEKTFYTGASVDGLTTRVFTIADTADQGNPNASYNLDANTYTPPQSFTQLGTARAIFTLGLNHSSQLI